MFRRPELNARAWGLLLAAATTTIGTALWATRSVAADAPKPTATAKAAMTVTTAKAEPASLSLGLAANGSVFAWQEASVGAEAVGLRLADVRAQVGDRVSAGQVLAVFASETVQADLAQAQAALMEAQATLADARANAERARSLEGTGALSAQQLGQMLTAEQAAQARVEAAKAAVLAQQLRLKHTQVLAPDSGVISARLATVGTVTGQGQELFRMIRQGRLEWRAEVTSTELPRIQPGQSVQVVAASGAQVQGKVRLVGPTVDPQTRNALVYVDLPAHAQIKPGMFARGDFQLGASAGLTVPQQALVVRDGFNHVFVVGADQRVSRRKVDTGRRAGDRVEILKGLEPATVVAVKGAGFLNEGDLVRVVDETPATK